MKFVIQRVSEASVAVDGNVIGSIEKGYLVLIGVSDRDTETTADKLVRKMTGLRIFEDESGKIAGRRGRQPSVDFTVHAVRKL